MRTRASSLAVTLLASVIFVPAALLMNNETLSSAAVFTQDDPERDRLLEDVTRARQMRDSGESGYGDLFRKTASRLARDGHLNDAIRVLDEIIDRPEHPFDKLSALRQQGQYYERLGNDAAALRAYQVQALFFEANLEQFRDVSLDFASGQLAHSRVLASRGQYATAVSVTDLLFDTDLSTKLPDNMIVSLRLARSEYMERVGRHADAAREIDELFADVPGHGKTDGEAVHIMLRRILLADPSRSSQSSVDALIQIWDTVEFQGNPRILDAGSHLLEALSRRKEYDEFVLFADEISRFIDTNRDSWLSKASDDQQRRRLSRHIEQRKRSALVAIQSAAERVGEFDLLVDALEQLRDLESDPKSRIDFQNQIHKAQRRR